MSTQHGNIYVADRDSEFLGRVQKLPPFFGDPVRGPAEDPPPVLIAQGQWEAAGVLIQELEGTDHLWVAVADFAAFAAGTYIRSYAADEPGISPNEFPSRDPGDRLYLPERKFRAG